MKNTLIFSLLVIVSFFTSCSNDDKPAPSPPPNKVILVPYSLGNLGENYKYEVWLKINNTLESIGDFTVNDEGASSKGVFPVDPAKLALASALKVSIEPKNDTNANISDVVILSGVASGSSFALKTTTNFENVKGFYTLSTPTDGNNDQNEKSGIWFVKNGAAGLTLPALDTGWKYEAWIKKGGKEISLGKFTAANSSDDFNGYSESAAPAPSFPGEDFLKNAPTGVTFPIDLDNTSISISVEPYPDNSPERFTTKVLLARLTTGVVNSINGISNPVEHVPLEMIHSTSIPNGVAVKKYEK